MSDFETIDEAAENDRFFGEPIDDVHEVGDGMGRYHHYEHGTILWHPHFGTHTISTIFRSKYFEVGFVKRAGYPIEDERPLNSEDVNKLELHKYVEGNIRGTILVLEKGCLVNIDNSANRNACIYISRVNEIHPSRKDAFKDLEANIAPLESEFNKQLFLTELFANRSSDLLVEPVLITEIVDAENELAMIVYHPGYNYEIQKEELIVVGEKIDSNLQGTNDKNVITNTYIYCKYRAVEKSPDDISKYSRPIFRLSDNSKKAFAYKANVEEYKALLLRKRRTLNEIISLGGNTTLIPPSLDREYVMCVVWEDKFAEWFEKNGFKKPVIKFNNAKLSFSAPPRKMIWNASLAEAAKVVVDKFKMDQDQLPDNRKWNFVKEASDEFFNSYVFPKRPKSTPASFYENVKQYLLNTRVKRG